MLTFLKINNIKIQKPDFCVCVCVQERTRPHEKDRYWRSWLSRLSSIWTSSPRTSTVKMSWLRVCLTQIHAHFIMVHIMAFPPVAFSHSFSVATMLGIQPGVKRHWCCPDCGKIWFPDRRRDHAVFPVSTSTLNLHLLFRQHVLLVCVGFISGNTSSHNPPTHSFGPLETLNRYVCVSVYVCPAKDWQHIQGVLLLFYQKNTRYCSSTPRSSN